MSETTTLLLDIHNPLLFCYAQCLFKKRNGALLAHRTTATGSVICSLAQISTIKPIHRLTERTVTIIIPQSNAIRPLLGRFAFLSEDDAQIVIGVLGREFKLAFAEYINEGTMAGLPKRQIVELFIQDHNLGSVPTALETLIKRRQRITGYAIDNFNTKLRKMAYNNSQKAKKRVLNSR